MERRSLLNTLFFPVKLKYTLFVILAGMILFGAVMTYLMVQLNLLYDGTYEPRNITRAMLFEQNLSQFSVIIPLVFFLFTAFVAHLSVAIVKQIRGEMVAINAQLDEVLHGNTSLRRNLRDADNFHDTMNRIHRLADRYETALEKTQGKSKDKS